MEEPVKKVLGMAAIPAETVEKIRKSVKNIADFKKEIEKNSEQDTTILTNIILSGAVILEASDIHIEPHEKQSRLRIRIDGVLRDIAFLGQGIYHNLLFRLKLLSKIKLNITHKPQDGRFTIAMGELPIEIRTSILPAEYGESIVMRILNPKSLMKLDVLGLRKDLYEIFQKEIAKPNGMIIVTGPTGAGKTTTLYAFLMEIQNPEIEIITIEDPIEYHINGVLQTQVDPEKGYSFAEGLKSIVRQDPDVILIGEIRDAETAKISLQSALTGHLVLSTMHTNDAAGAIPRLIDLGAQSSSIAPAVKMIVSERLIRKVCKKCSVLEKPTAKEIAEIKEGLQNLPKNMDIPKKLAGIKIPRDNKDGCEDCNHTGYKGRKGLFETFLVDNEMERLILTNPAVSVIKDKLKKKGMITMYQSGLIEVVAGETTLEEVRRVVEIE